VAFGQPAVALAAKLGARAAAFGLDVPPAGVPTDMLGDDEVTAADALFRIAYAAGARGEDPESALRAVARAHADALAAAENGRAAAG
jgi:XTP/dITP diphosphohydrolase